MKDLTPIAAFDPVLQERERVGAVAQDGASVNVVGEELMRKKRERYERCLPVARDILEEARSALAVRFRFLDRALWRMPLEPCFDVYGIASDGRRFLYDPIYVVDRFKLSPNEVVRDVVHCLFHCIFRHPFMLYSVLRQPWDVACDIAIEAMLLDLLGEAFPCNMDRRAKDTLRVLRAQAGGVLTAERLYHVFCEKGKHVDLKSLAPMFRHDSHGPWYGDDAEQGRREGSAALPTGSEQQDEGHRPSPQGDWETLDDILQAGQGDEHEGAPVAEAPVAREDGEAEACEGADGGVRGADRASSAPASENPAAPCDEELARAWEDVSRRMQVDLEAHLAKQGEGAGSLVANLCAVNRERYDYGDFLRRFATLHERMRVNDDEFDYIYYTFGLARYGNLPLIEPLEYKEDVQVHDFVIAIDTSESCSGETVQAFMRKTYNILKQVECFSSRVNIHVVQCDAAVQKDTKITSLDQLELYLENLQLKGFGGTDFRPVFSYVDMLVEKGEFSDLRGIVYFTDGQGTFPRRPPAYDAAFVFLDDGYTDPVVPPWALKVILNEKELPAR